MKINKRLLKKDIDADKDTEETPGRERGDFFYTTSEKKDLDGYLSAGKTVSEATVC